MTEVLIVDDDPEIRRHASKILADAGFASLSAATGDAALECLRTNPRIGAMLLDPVLPERDGMAVLEAMARDHLDLPVIALMAAPTAAAITDIRRAGAMDYLEKPLRPERLLVTLHNALDRHRLREALAAERHRRLGTPRLTDFVAEVPEMQRAKLVAARAARSRLPVLIEGEAGTGREFLARLIHAGSERAGRPFIAFREGAADFAEACRAAQGGTLFAEEIGDLSPQNQLALCRYFEVGTLQIPASARPQRFDVRIIATSSRRLLDLTLDGDFREDLFYRLNVLPTYLPPLRQRLADIEPLVSHFIFRFAAELGREIAGIAPEALDLLKASPWPLNVRQLEGAICRAVALAETPRLRPIDFPDLLVARAGRDAAARTVGMLNAASALVQLDPASLRQHKAVGRMQLSDRFLDGEKVASLAAVERGLIGFALAHHEGRMSEVARALGIGRSTLYRKLREYGLDGAAEENAA